MSEWQGYDQGGEDPLWWPETPFKLVPANQEELPVELADDGTQPLPEFVPGLERETE